MHLQTVQCHPFSQLWNNYLKVKWSETAYLNSSMWTNKKQHLKNRLFKLVLLVRNKSHSLPWWSEIVLQPATSSIFSTSGFQSCVLLPLCLWCQMLFSLLWHLKTTVHVANWPFEWPQFEEMQFNFNCTDKIMTGPN